MQPSANRHVLAILRREIGGMFQREFAEAVGCSEETIRKIEKGGLKLSEPLGLKISNQTGVDFKWLMTNDLQAQIVPNLEGKISNPEDGEKYTQRTFEVIQARRRAAMGAKTIVPGGRTYDFNNPKLWAGILKGEKSEKQKELVRYKLGKYLEQLGSEFGIKPVNAVLEEGLRLVIDRPRAGTKGGRKKVKAD